ncbi:hypothetical protein BDY19DRAFT_624412 [Irpex rosettiformis]|uniref:Uncharacterized protein n=1 Tax=Irpex rosettiformis TaxID=378272 RepID=A0ACB8UAZ5_9APHY|nr:hypothetical protein BDY19DRAFT_624412 [Irpex rosettiformis]
MDPLFLRLAIRAVLRTISPRRTSSPQAISGLQLSLLGRDNGRKSSATDTVNRDFIHKLPREVLAMIFLALRDAYAVPMYQCDFQWYNNVYRWYSQTKLVCRLWREVSQEYCMLWTVIEASLPERHFLINKAKTAPLTVIYNPGAVDTEIPPFFEGYHSEFPRIKSLALIGARQWYNAFKDVQVLPKLEELRLYRRALGHEDPKFLLQDLAMSFPALTTVDILGYRFLPHYSIFSHNIRSLRLALNFEERSEVDGLYQATMAIVQKMPLLEHLGLHGVLTGYDAAINHPQIVLPHLHCLSVSAPPESCLALLSMLKFPNDTHMDIKCIDVNLTDWAHIPKLFSVLRTKLDGSDTLGDFHSVESLIVQGCPIVPQHRSMILMHCLKTQNPYGPWRPNENTAFFCQSLGYVEHAIESPAFTNWREDKMMGVRLVLVTEEGPMVFPDKWFSIYCHDWPLHSVKTCTVGLGYVSVPEVRRLCPEITTLFLDTEVYAEFCGVQFPHTVTRSVGDDSPSLAKTDGEKRKIPKFLSHLPWLETLTLLLPTVGSEDSDELIQIHMGYLTQAGILKNTIKQLKFVRNHRPVSFFDKGTMEVISWDLNLPIYRYEQVELDGMIYL